MTDLSRRETIALIGASLSIIAARPIGAPIFVGDDLADWVRAALADVSAPAVAAAWMARRPAERTRVVLEKALLVNRRRGETVEALLQRCIAAEHAVERTEVLDGWHLAPTEARLLTYCELLRTGS